MMELKRCRQFRVALALSSSLILSTGCATANVSPASGEPPKELAKLPSSLKAELSSQTVSTGTIALLTVELPAEYQGKPVTGIFEGMELPFFPISQKPGSEVAGTSARFATVLSIPYDHAPGNGSIQLRLGDGPQQSDAGTVEFKVVQGEYPSEVLKVDGRRVHPKKKSDLARIAKEQIEIGRVYKAVTLSKYWEGPFIKPIESEITSAFGTRRVYNGELKSFHGGVDLRAPMKTPIYSAAAGKVVMAKNLFYTGNTVMLDHGYGIITLYAHMSRLKVKKGEDVKAHQLLGLSGKTGRVNGPHLHWQAIVHKVKVNPFGLIEVLR